MTLNKLFLKLKGGTGSGNFGHSGRPGKRGGSLSSHGFLSDRKTLDLKIQGRVTGIDEGIYKLVKQMNKVGLRTLHSCSGHTCDRPLESQISFMLGKYDDGANEKLDKIKTVINSGKLNHNWVLNEDFPMNKKELFIKGGFYDTQDVLSSEENVRKAVDDFGIMLSVIKKIT